MHLLSNSIDAADGSNKPVQRHQPAVFISYYPKERVWRVGQESAAGRYRAPFRQGPSCFLRLCGVSSCFFAPEQRCVFLAERRVSCVSWRWSTSAVFFADSAIEALTACFLFRRSLPGTCFLPSVIVYNYPELSYIIQACSAFESGPRRGLNLFE